MMPQYIYVPLVAGIVTPPLIKLGLTGSILPSPSIIGVLMFMLLAMIPFIAFIVLMDGISAKIKGSRLECIFWGGFLPVWGFTAYGHWSVWYPIYAHTHMSSTAVIAFLFIPFYALVPLVIGLLIGWGVSFLPPFQEGKPPARKEREDWRM